MNRTALSVPIFVAFLAACGGGDSFNGDGGVPPAAGGFTIDTGNAPLIISTAYATATTSADFVGLADSTGLTGAAGAGKPAMHSNAGGIIDLVVASVPIGPDTQPCAVSGTVTFSADVVDPVALPQGALSVGDTFRVEYANCDDGIGEVIDGTVDLVVDAFSGDILSGAYEMTMAMDVTNLQVTTADDVLSSNGDATASINTLDAPFVSASVSGSSMSLSSNASSETLSAYDSTQTLDAGISPSPYTMSAGGTLDSSQLPGVVTYSTPDTFAGFDANYPHTGVFLVESASSSARLIAVDDVNVTIEIDADKDGDVDETIETTWAELLGS